MKKLFILFIFIFNFAHSNSLGLTNTDLIILKKIKTLTDDTMMKYTLMAIAVKESSVGKNQVNVISNDYGLFQSNIKSVLSFCAPFTRKEANLILWASPPDKVDEDCPNCT